MPENGRDSWLAGKRPVLRFVAVLAAATIAFNAIFYLWFSRLPLFEGYLALNAKASAVILNLFGDNVTINGTSVRSDRFAMDIHLGCDGIQASAFFVFAVLASPLRTSLRARLGPAVLGTILLLAMNLVRILTLYWTGVHYRSAFEVMHVEVWQAAFIFLPLLLWLLWVRWAVRARIRRSDGPD
ncbi:MAG: archaeosortase/exosortase family protein [Phycisphaerae bacterium]|jgi:exosortase/archaeosortase family protein